MAPRFRVPTPPRLSTWAAWAVAVALPAVAYVVQSEAPDLFVHDAFAPYFFAVAVAAWVAGFGPALAAVALSAALGHSFLESGDTVPRGTHLASTFFIPFGVVVATISAGARAGFRERERVAEELRASEQRERARAEELQGVMEAVPALVLIARDREAKDVLGSRAALHLLRIKPGGSPSRSADRPPAHFRIFRDGRLVPPDEGPTQLAARGIRSEDLELEIVFDDGTRRRIFGNAEPIFGADGLPRGGIGAFIDVTKLTDALHARDEFLAIASHELKTPLTTLRLRAEALLRHRDASPAVARAAAAIERQVDRVDALVASLLEVSRLHESGVRLVLEDVDLAAIAHEAAIRFAGDAATAGSTIRVEGRASVGRWDRARVEQIVTNLLSNAVKYGAGEPILVRVAADGALARISISDGGPGIAPEQQGRIFERFERGGAPRDRGGLGLGLWMARELAGRLGGRIAVESAPGAGATFTVELPLAGPPQDPAAAASG
jgi:signal transduction histidine kinase